MPFPCGANLASPASIDESRRLEDLKKGDAATKAATVSSKAAANALDTPALISNRSLLIFRTIGARCPWRKWRFAAATHCHQLMR